MRLSWDPAIWSVEGEFIEDGYEGLQIGTDISTIYLEAYDGFAGNAEACLAAAEPEIGEREGVSEVVPLTDRPLPVAADVRGAAGFFGLTASLPDGTSYRGVEYVECRTIVPGESVLEITWQVVTQAFNEDFANVETLLATIETPDVTPASTATQAPKTEPPTDSEVTELGANIRATVAAELGTNPDDVADPDTGELPPDSEDGEAVATPGIEGDTWMSPTYGFSISWAGTAWQPDPAGTLTAVGPERLDRVHLLNGVSSLYFEGATRYQGDLPACVAEEKNRLAQESGVSEVRSYRDEEGVHLIADGPDSSAAAFILTLAIGDQEVELVDYVECRTLIPGQAVLIITLVTQPDVFDQELAAAQTVIDTIVPSVGAAAFPQVLAAATAEAPLAGPTAGDLPHTVGDAALMQLGVEVEDFAARVVFVNPSNAADVPWDFGVAFREQENGDHYRLTVASDGTWEFQIGLRADLASGTVPSLVFEEGGRNVLEIVVAGDSAGFSINGVFVAELNTSELGGASDVWAGAGFHQVYATEGEITKFEDFTVWPLAVAEKGD